MGGVISGLTGSGVKSAAGGAAALESAAADRAIAEQRRQFGITQENIKPFIQAGTSALGDVKQAASIGGFEERLKQIFKQDALQSLIAERTRAVQGGLAAGGLTRSGAGIQKLAAVPTKLGLGVESLLSDRSSNLVNLGATTATGLGQLRGQSSSNISNLLQQQGQSQGAGLLTSAQGQAAAAQNLLSTAVTAGIFFSDPALKENVEQIGLIHDLGLFEWDWKAETKDTIVSKCWNKGFMADEVKQKYPHHVSEYGGFMVINYPALLDELESQEWQH